MANCDKLLALARRAGRGFRFEDARRLASCFGFVHVRTRGSHFIYARSDGRTRLNFQKRRNGCLPAYQVRQLLVEIDLLIGERRPG